jgi:hypothetical protein
MYQSDKEYQLFQHRHTRQVVRLRRDSDERFDFLGSPISKSVLHERHWLEINKSDYIGEPKKQFPQSFYLDS